MTITCEGSPSGCAPGLEKGLAIASGVFAPIALASWMLALAAAVGFVGVTLGSMTPSRQLRQTKARTQLPVARVVEGGPTEIRDPARTLENPRGHSW